MAATGLALKLLVGLGNPGAEYARTRHNVGWCFVDALAEQYGGHWRRERESQAQLARVRVDDSELWLLKPTGYMNRSGAPIAAVANFYRIAATDILVAHDDIDLPPGVCRLKEGGGHGGHNGLRDVIAHIGAPFWRLRFGVGHPGAKEMVIDAVLDRPSASEQPLIDAALERARDIVPLLLSMGAQRATQKLHSGNPRAEPDSGDHREP